jgi:hypothetical protein
VGGRVFVPQLCCLVGFSCGAMLRPIHFAGLVWAENIAGRMSTAGSKRKFTHQKEECAQQQGRGVRVAYTFCLYRLFIQFTV